MKMTSFLLLVLCLHVSARTASQDITLSVERMPLEKVFSVIKKQTGYVMFGNASLLKDTKPVSFAVSDMPLKNFLDLILKDQPLQFRIGDHTIFLSARYVSPAISSMLSNEYEKITGVLLNADTKDPLSGATVTIKNSRASVVTAANGSFTINASIGDVLVITYVGFQSRELKITTAAVGTILLQQNSTSLDETVVIGYGTTTVRDATGSVARLGTKEIGSVSTSSTIQSALQGFVSGVNVQVSSSSPTSATSVMIRGVSTLTGDGQPLWVIDGVPDYSAGTDGSVANILNSINMNDVESIDILKDASSTAIYGSRGANGVIMITTKKGRIQKPTLEASYNIATRKLNNNGFGVMTADEWKKAVFDGSREYIMTTGNLDATTRLFIDETYFRSFNTSHITPNMIRLRPDAFGPADMDWWNYMMKTSIDHKADLSIAGGTDATKYRLAVGYHSLNGNVRQSYASDFTVRANITTNVSKFLSIGLNANAAARKTNNKESLISQIITFRPDNAPYTDAGEINDLADDPTTSFYENPLVSLANKSNGYGRNIAASLFADFQILPYLKFRTTENINYNNYETDNFYRRGSYGINAGRRDVSYNQTFSNVWENILTFNKSIGRHSLNAVAGLSMETFNRKYVAISASGFPDDDTYTSLSNATTVNKPVETYSENALVSQFIRLNYDFDRRYMVTGTMRRDGSSRFGKDNRYGTFPSAAVAWNISDEKFFKSLLPVVNYLKLRASMGVTGSQNLRDYEWRPLMNGAQFEGQPALTPSALFGSTATQIGNYDLQWEQAIQKDIALETAFLNERLRITLGWYEKKVNNMIYVNSLPPSMGYASMSRNVADIRNRGLELDINTVLIKRPGHELRFNFNISGNKSRVLNLDGVVTELYNTAGAFFVQSIRLKQNGPLGEFYGIRSAGRLYYTMEEIYGLRNGNLSATGVSNPVRLATERPGDAYFIDKDGNGVIDANDREVLGNFYPTAYGGFNLQYTWRNFSAISNFSYSYGNLKYFYYLSRMQSVQMGTFFGKQNSFSMFTDNASSNGPTAAFPRIPNNLGNNQWFSDSYIYDASYLRLTNLSISYNLPRSFFKKGFIANATFTASASNLFTITKYPGMDPQGNFDVANKNMFGLGMDMSYYPPATEFRAGLKFIFK